VVRGLEHVEAHYRHDIGTIRYTGKCGPLRVSVSEKCLTIRGSLSLFSGLTEMTRQDVLHALHQLEEMLGISLATARAFRVDVFNDFQLEQHPAAYFPLLLAYPRLQHYSYSGTSVGFQCQARSIKFYDKGAQRENSRVGTPGPLRIEVAWLKDLSKQVNRKVSAYDLASPDTWQDFARRYVQEYHAITKARSMLPLDTSAPSLKHVLAVRGLIAEGLDTVLRDLGRKRDAGIIVSKAYQRRRRYLLDLAADPRYTERSPLLDELDTAVEDAASAMMERGA